MDSRFHPVHTRVRCIDPLHRDHQHAQKTGRVTDNRLTLVMGGAELLESEVVWDNVESVQRHDLLTLERVYSREEMLHMRSELENELRHLREDVS